MHIAGVILAAYTLSYPYIIQTNYGLYIWPISGKHYSTYTWNFVMWYIKLTTPSYLSLPSYLQLPEHNAMQTNSWLEAVIDSNRRFKWVNQLVLFVIMFWKLYHVTVHFWPFNVHCSFLSHFFQSVLFTAFNKYTTTEW